MSLEKKIEAKIQNTRKKLQEIEINLENLQRELQILEENSTSSEDMAAFIENKDNFSNPIWEKLQKEKKILEEKMNRELNSIPDPNLNKKAYSEKGTIQPHWIFVR